MSNKGIKIYFVTWPDGKVVEGSQTGIDSSAAVRQTVKQFLPDCWFGNVELGHIWGGALSALWRGMKEKGFEVHEFVLPDDIIKPK